MWPDNETDVDLLGFDFLVDELLVLLREPRLLPVTVGVAGDWGSGKSSLLAMTARDLEADAEGHYVVVRFSPWMFEGYEDVKTALMQAVLRALKTAVANDKTNFEKARDLFLRLVRRVDVFTVVKTVATAAVVAGTGTPPAIAALAGGAWLDTSDLAPKPVDDKPIEATSVADFRQEFASLMRELEDVRALVVFVDDVDRCAPDTVLETFEAIRLFLHVPKTAYVIAADQRVVQAAVDYRYRDALGQHPTIGKDYLEKILQITVAIPPLSVPEAESYINLLMAEAHVAEGQMSKLRDAAKCCSTDIR